MVVNCPNCGKENKNTNIKCEFCSTQLIDENIAGIKEFAVSSKKMGCLVSILIMIFVGPWLLFGIVFLGVGLFSSISEHNQAKGYEKTTGILIDYENCTYEDDGSEHCEAIYEYEIDGVTYTVSPSTLGSSNGGFKEFDTVYYNPDNPSESIIYSSWNGLIFVGFVIVVVLLAILISIGKSMKKKLKGKDNITMKFYNPN